MWNIIWESYWTASHFLWNSHVEIRLVRIFGIMTVKKLSILCHCTFKFSTKKASSFWRRLAVENSVWRTSSSQDTSCVRKFVTDLIVSNYYLWTFNTLNHRHNGWHIPYGLFSGSTWPPAILRGVSIRKFKANLRADDWNWQTKR